MWNGIWPVTARYVSSLTSAGTCAVACDRLGNPLTWDGEPVYHPETVQEGLFDPAAFEQMAGQTALDT